MSLTKVTYTMISGAPANVEDFGAGSTESAATNTAAIQAAIATGKTVCINETLNVSAFSVSDKNIDIVFQNSGKLVFAAADSDDLVFTNCTGQIQNYQATHAGDLGGGVFSGLKLNGCSDLLVNGFVIDGKKDIPLYIFNSDNTKAINGFSSGTALDRPFCAGQVSYSKDSGFQNCSAKYVSFGFLVIGSGYKSGGVTPPRTFDQEQGMFVRDCYVFDHTGHAFDINGAIGASISRCVADSYTGTVGYSSFQIKNSTNIPEELEIDTRSSVIENCTAFNAWIGFVSQATRGAKFLNNTAIRSQSYALYLNDADFAVVDGLDVEDWCLSNSATGLNSETKVSAVGVSTTSSDCSISGIRLRLKDTPNASNMRQVFAGGAKVHLSDMRVQFVSGASSVSEGVVISGSNCWIAEDVVVAFATSLLVDNALTTAYEMSYGITWSFSSGTSATFNLSPTRGMTVGAVNSYVVSGTVSGHLWSVGRVGDNDALVLSRAVADETVVPDGAVKQLFASEKLQAFGSAGTGTVTLNITVGGVSTV